MPGRTEPSGAARVLVAVPFLAERRELLQPLRAAGFEPVFNETGRMYDEEGLVRALAGAVAVIAGVEPYSARVLDAVPTLRIIARFGVGYDTVDLEAAARRRIAVTITPGANHEAVADHAMALIAALLQGLPAYDRSVRDGGWGTRFHPGLSGRTLGLVGFGRIGRATARRALAFGMRVLATDPAVPAGEIRAQGVLPVELDRLFAEADVVSLHAPLTPATRRLVDSRRLSRMRPGSYLVNTARGELVDEAALVEALRHGPLAGAALDVFGAEPLPPSSPLRSLANVILTPHVAGLSEDAIARMTRACVDNILRLWRGESVPGTCLLTPGVPPDDRTTDTDAR